MSDVPRSPQSPGPETPPAAPAAGPLPSPAARTPTRRRALAAGTATLGAAALGAGTLGASPAWAEPGAGRGRRITDPFTLGVASGDPLPDGFVLWTRLAPEPLAEDGHGGMPDRRVRVRWQVAADERFRRVVAAGAEFARPEEGHSVHVEVHGLRPGAEYFYRFRVGREFSPVGRTKTAPRPGDRLDRFAFAFASCQNFPSGYYTAHAHMAQEDLDLVCFLGDYIYEGGAQGELGRGHLPAREVFSLADYRVRHAQHKTDEDLQAAHAAFPWAVVFDDHEVENNWADDISEADDEPDQDPEVFLRRRARAFQVYYEHMPLRRAQRPRGAAMQLFRRLTFGDLVDVHLLDTRQYRSDQVGDAGHADPGRTLLGARQREWLLEGLHGPTARWNVLAQQVFFSQRQFLAPPESNFTNDGWDGYRYERDRIRDQLASGPSNPVVITGDVHANYLCDVKADFDDPDSATVATELVGTSITSGGDGEDQRPGDLVQLEQNPHIKLINRRRGYVRNQVSRDQWRTDYRIVDYVSRRGAPVRDLATCVIEEGRPGAQQV
ncbi:alkaline phosphatase [Streptomonospora sp. PA3]|uniref:alkaline phosphatase D family protein n=1 Tax=Streptomonospora sp. PA3 TaxID=2607326 RepID=UPI0012DE1BC7|nr:alkaline phosphatase D family protein [Streptomonospora sp. PA3]MUL40634.1 alkaline phosphatase [Streptomonospora sp. PA3]